MDQLISKALLTTVVLACILLLYGLAVTVYNYLSLPIEYRDYDNNCQWVEYIGEKGIEYRPCTYPLPINRIQKYVPPTISLEEYKLLRGIQ